MDYEKKYKEALKRANDFIKGEAHYALECGDNIMCWVFPELKESEDEKIRKELIDYLKERKSQESYGQYVLRFNRWIEWLEKQGKQKVSVVDFKAEDWYVSKVDGKIYNAKFMEKHPTNQVRRLEIENAAMSATGIIEREEWFIKGAEWADKNPSISSENQCEQKPADMVEPKFKVGDWIIDVQDGEILHINKVHDYAYEVTNLKGGIYELSRCSIETCNRLWTIQDAKDGDILVYGDNPNYHHVKVIMIFKSLRNENSAFTHFHIFDDEFRTNDWCDCGKNAHPATREQRDLLFQKMKEKGYEWNAEKKGLRKIENEIEIPFGAKDNELQEVTYYIPQGFHAEINDNNVIIKKGEKPTAWNEGDEKAINDIMWIIETYRKNGFNETHTQMADDSENWLKALEERLK